MVDAGLRPGTASPEPIGENFEFLRREDRAQEDYLIGRDFEGIPFGPVRVGAQLTPPRQYILQQAAEELVLDTDLALAQSLALGGLGAGWGASAMPYSDPELGDWPLGRGDLQAHYDAVAERVGICGAEDDDLSDSVGPIHPLLPPAKQDSNGLSIRKRYEAHRRRFHRRGLRLGHPRLAAATEPWRGRGPLAYHDMEFYSDADRAVYRPRYTVEEMTARFPEFAYAPGWIAEEYRESADGIALTLRPTGGGGERRTVRARQLVLAAGVLGTARIVLRSEKRFGEPLPFVTNPYIYYPCLNWPRLGKPSRKFRHSLTQLTALFDPDGSGARDVQLQLYSYRSLLLFKLVKESPLAARESLRLMRALSEYYVIVGLHHPDRPGEGKFLRLYRGETARQDQLEVRHALSSEDEAWNRRQERRILRTLLWLGLLPLKRIDPGGGASIHYGGPLPMTDAAGAGALTATAEGRLRARTRVRVADGAAFPNLPAKGPTFTLMAWADRVGRALLREGGAQ